jgi:alpha-tubulin suppressor-like RCC1 family protein
VWCWGDTARGQGGLVANSTIQAVTQVTAISNATDIATEADHTCAVINDGSVFCWGANGYAQSGGNPAGSQATPTKVKADATNDFAGAAEVATGTAHTCIRKTEGSVWCWGVNGFGTIGNGTQDFTRPRDGSGDGPSSDPRSARYPTQVLLGAGQPLTGATAISANHGRSCALVGGHPYCWGNNKKGGCGTAVALALYAAPFYACGN